MIDVREELVNELCMSVLPYNIDVRTLKNEFYMILDKYEIQNRCTQVSVLQQDRNEFLIKKFIIAKTVKGCTKRTIEYYSSTIPKFIEMIGKTIDDVTPDDIRRYEAVRLIKDKVTKTTVANEIRNLSSFFTWLRNEEYITRNPMIRVDRIKVEKKKMEALTEIEIEKLRSHAKDEREKVIIEVLLSTGCRVSEFANIKISDIENNRILVRGKGEKERYVYLNAKSIIAIEEYLAKRNDKNPYLLPKMVGVDKVEKRGMSQKEYHKTWEDQRNVLEDGHLDISSISAITRRLAKRAGVEQANPHKFRRTCATLALRRGMPLLQVSKMLGHESVETTQIYLDLNEDELEHAHKIYVV